MSDLKRSYYAIIPANVRYDRRLKPNSKLLYGEITALCNERGFCWAGNEYFAELYEVSKETISRWISDLIECGYLTREIIYKEGTNQIINRYLRINQYPIDEKINTPIDEKVKDNNTSFNNTINNTINNTSYKSDVVPYLEIIDYLNLKAEKRFKCVPGHKKYIKARWNEGYRLDDFKRVIEIKSKEWLNTPAVKYLQPSTLFGTKFDQYLNQKDTNPIGFNNNYSKKSVRKEVLPDWATDDYDYKEVEAKKAKEMAEFNEKLSAIDFDDDLPF